MNVVHVEVERLQWGLQEDGRDSLVEGESWCRSRCGVHFGGMTIRMGAQGCWAKLQYHASREILS